MQHIDYVPILSIIFIIYEVIKIFFAKKYWICHVINKGWKQLRWVELLYVAFLISLFFHPGLWIYSLIITISAFIFTSRLSEDAVRKNDLTYKNRIYFIADGLVCIISLSIIVLKEFYALH